jgi:hypothetical protein
MSQTPTENIPVFYVCITATQEGPPIEIAWASLAFETHGVICESRLIQPPAPWSSELTRAPAGLQVYGLSLSDLRDFGTPPLELAEHMNEALADRQLFSATLADDARIRRIFDAAKMAPEFALRKSDAEALIAELARLRRLSPATLARAKREAEVMSLTGIRAEAKARYLATFWAIVMQQT